MLRYLFFKKKSTCKIINTLLFVTLLIDFFSYLIIYMEMPVLNVQLIK